MSVTWTLVAGSYQVASADHLWCIMQRGSGYTSTGGPTGNAFWSATYKQTANINLNSGGPITPIGNATTKFTGTYDGDGYGIANWSYTNYNTTDVNIGLFGYTTSATIKNLRLCGKWVIDSYSVLGMLVGYLSGGSVTNITATFDDSSFIHSNSTATALNVGGLIGISAAAAVQGLYLCGQLTIQPYSGVMQNVGGVIGNVGTSSTVSMIVNNARMDINAGTGTAALYIGGVLGNVGVTCTYLMNNMRGGNISGYNIVGGVVGRTLGTGDLTYVHNGMSGNIYTSGASAYSGGIVGNYQGGTISYCTNYMKGNIYGDGATHYCGGIVGFCGPGTYTNNVVAMRGTVSGNNAANSGAIRGIATGGTFTNPNVYSTAYGGSWGSTTSGSSSSITGLSSQFYYHSSFPEVPLIKFSSGSYNRAQELPAQAEFYGYAAYFHGSGNFNRGTEPSANFGLSTSDLYLTKTDNVFTTYYFMKYDSANNKGLISANYPVAYTNLNSLYSLDGTTKYFAFQITSIAVTHAGAYGSSTGALTPTIDNGTGGSLTYAWTGGASTLTTQNIDSLPAGTYTLTVTSSSTGQSVSSSATVKQQLGSITATATDATTYGSSTGSVALSVLGGISLSYSWVNSSNVIISTSQNLTSVAANTYTVTVTDSSSYSGNVLTATATVKQQLGTPTTTVTNATTYGSTNGSVALTVLGGIGTLTYSWKNSSNVVVSTSQNLASVGSGTYTVSVTDSASYSGNTVTAVAATVKEQLGSVSATPTNVTSAGGSNGAITLIVLGGTGTITYSWKNGNNTVVGTTQNLTSLGSGTYSVTVTDSSTYAGNVLTTSAQVYQPLAIITSVVSIANPYGSSTASAQALTTTDSGVTTSTWKDSSNVSYIPVETSVSYTGGTWVNINSALVASVVGTRPSAVTGNAVQMGSSSFKRATYAYSGLDTTASDWTLQCFVYLSSSTSTFSTSGANASMIFNHSVIYFQVYFDTSGKMNLGVPGNVYTGTNTYTYGNWYHVAFCYQASSKQAAVFINGSRDVNVTLASALPATLVTVPLYIGGSSSSSQNYQTLTGYLAGLALSSTVRYNSHPYTVPTSYLKDQYTLIINQFVSSVGSTTLNDPSFTSTISTLPANTYTVTFSNVAGLYTTTSSSIPVGQALTTPTLTVTNATTYGSSTGSIALSVLGGAGTLSYSWKNSSSVVVSTSQNLTSAAAGTYSGTVTDSVSYSGNIVTASATILQQIGIPTALVTNATVYGSTDGSATLSAVGGIGTLSYSWKNSSNVVLSNTQYLTAVGSGTYTGTVTDSATYSGNVSSTTAVVKEQLGSVTATPTNATTYGSSTGSVALSVLGGISLTYSWKNSSNVVVSTNQNLTSVAASTYTVTVTDSSSYSGNVLTATATVKQQLGTPTTSVTHASYGSTNGSIALTVLGGIGTLTYSWKNSSSVVVSTSQNLTSVGAGTYTATVTDSSSYSGNVVTSAAAVVKEQLGSVAATATDVTIAGGSNGSVTLVVLGGVGTITYSWKNINNTVVGTTQNLTSLGSNTYTVTVTDSASYVGNVLTTSASVYQPMVIVTSVVAIANPYGSSTASVRALTTTNGGITTSSWKDSSNVAYTPTESSVAYTGGTWTNTNGCTIASVVGTRPSAVTGNSAQTGSSSLKRFSLVYPYLDTSLSDWTIECFVYFSATSGTFQTNGANVAMVFNNTPANFQMYFDSAGKPNLQANGTYYTGTGSYTYGNWYHIAVCYTQSTKNVALFIGGSRNVNATLASAITASIVTTSIVIAGSTDGGSQYQTLTGYVAGLALSNSSRYTTATYTVPVSYPTGNALIINQFVSAVGSSTLNDPSFTSTISSLPAGTYTSTLRNLTGLYTATASSIAVGQALNTPSLTVTNATTYGSSTGSIALSVLGGTGTLTYSWKNSSNVVVSTTQNLTSVAAGIYTATVTDSSSYTGNVITSTATVKQQLGSVSATPTNATTYGSSTGSIALSVLGGITLSYSWKNSSGAVVSIGQNLTSVIADTYTVTVTDSSSYSGNVLTAVATVKQQLGTLTTIVTNATTYGSATGSVALSVLGGIGTLTYSWRNSSNAVISTSQNLSSVGAGTYTVTVTDSSIYSGNVMTNTATVKDQLGSATATATNAAAYGSSTGSVVLAVLGGIGTLSYSWNNAGNVTVSTSQNLTAVPADTYTVVVTDSSSYVGNALTSSATVKQQLGALSVVVTNATAYGSANGSVNLIALGGIGTLSYSWKNSGNAVVSTGQNLTNVGAGRYTATVTDSSSYAGNAVSTTADVKEPLGSLSIAVTNATTYGTATGSVSLSLLGGINPAYSWTNGSGVVVSTGQNLIGVVAGMYLVTVTDSPAYTGNVLTSSATIKQYLGTPSIAVTHASTYGAADGALDVTVLGGLGTFSYSWTLAGTVVGTTKNLTNLSAGTYTVAITDSVSYSGNTVSASMIVYQPFGAVTATATDSATYGGTGSIALAFVGGVSFVTYIWTLSTITVSTSQNLAAVGAGTYTVTLTDSVGNLATASATVYQPLGSVSLQITNPSSFGAADGAITLAYVGGKGVTFSWSGGKSSSTQHLTNLTSGMYTVVVSSTLGNPISSTATLYDPLKTVTLKSTNVTLYGYKDGAISVRSLVGGVPPLVYVWSNGVTGDTASKLGPGTYTLTVTDDSLVTKIVSAVVTEPSPDPLTFPYVGSAYDSLPNFGDTSFRDIVTEGFYQLPDGHSSSTGYYTLETGQPVRCGEIVTFCDPNVSGGQAEMNLRHTDSGGASIEECLTLKPTGTSFRATSTASRAVSTRMAIDESGISFDSDDGAVYFGSSKDFRIVYLTGPDRLSIQAYNSTTHTYETHFEVAG